MRMPSYKQRLKQRSRPTWLKRERSKRSGEEMWIGSFDRITRESKKRRN
jgi:hypothetical protein